MISERRESAVRSADLHISSRPTSIQISPRPGKKTSILPDYAARGRSSEGRSGVRRPPAARRLGEYPQVSVQRSTKPERLSVSFGP